MGEIERSKEEGLKKIGSHRERKRETERDREKGRQREKGDREKEREREVGRAMI